MLPFATISQVLSGSNCQVFSKYFSVFFSLAAGAAMLPAVKKRGGFYTLRAGLGVSSSLLRCVRCGASVWLSSFGRLGSFASFTML
jgi:hypothetical protein